MNKLEPSFFLKDQLFNPVTVTKIASQIQSVYPVFKQDDFIADVLVGFPGRELMERIYWMRECLYRHLPSEYRQAVQVLLEALPPVSDPTLSDNDFGEFIYAPYGNFVATYGTESADLQFSLQALKELTKRFSVEFPIRTFINLYPEQTFTVLESWSTDVNYHVRRLVSEGTRPKLPWAKKIQVSYKKALPLLDALYADTTRYVTRSVANHLNDISKIDPEVVISTLKRWQKTKRQDSKEMQYITRHALRSLIRAGNTQALALLGFGAPHLTVTDFTIESAVVAVGESVAFSCTVRADSGEPQSLLVDYVLHFQKANGTLAAKTFKLAKVHLQPNERKTFQKTHPLRLMSTRVLYPGRHEIELQINGKSYGTMPFDLVQ